MTSKLNQRAKRKNNFLDAKNEPNMKALKKEYIIAQFNALQAKYDNLENKNIAIEKENKYKVLGKDELWASLLTIPLVE